MPPVLELLESRVTARAAALRVRRVRVALAGCGAVGGELVRLLHERGAYLEASHGVRFELVRVLVRDAARPRAAGLAPGVLTTELASFLAAEADLVVEALGGVEPALTIARAALAAGRRLVTANKALLAGHGAELARLARRGGARLDFEAAVGGGVPVVRLLREALHPAEVLAVRGVLNGTTNFILSRLAEGERFTDALAEAQRRGFAEADPTRDLDGRDAADKLRLLAWLAFGADPAALRVECRGLLPDPDRLAAAARRRGGVVRLLAECAMAPDGALRAVVKPVLVAAGSAWAETRDEQNRIEVETRWNGTTAITGPGAGGAPTATALLSDMLHAGC